MYTYIYIYINPIYIYIYIYSHLQTDFRCIVTLQGWLDMRDASSKDRNPADLWVLRFLTQDHHHFLCE